MAPRAVRTRLSELAARYDLPRPAAAQLEELLGLVADEPAAITAVRDPAEGVDVHVADSLVALDLEEVRGARTIADIGSGGGFPGLVLATALPAAQVRLVESVGRKCAFLDRAAAMMGLDNVEVVNARAEEWAAGLGANDIVTVRAVAPLPVLVEYAAPLLEGGGVLVAWKGRRDPAEEADGAAAAMVLGMEPPRVRVVDAFAGADDRHLYPERLPASCGNGPQAPTRSLDRKVRPLRRRTIEYGGFDRCRR
jgi:16S rRNA (guanine527-N7)-methyltransferase